MSVRLGEWSKDFNDIMAALALMVLVMGIFSFCLIVSWFRLCLEERDWTTHLIGFCGLAGIILGIIVMTGHFKGYLELKDLYVLIGISFLWAIVLGVERLDHRVQLYKTAVSSTHQQREVDQ